MNGFQLRIKQATQTYASVKYHRKYTTDMLFSWRSRKSEFPRKESLLMEKTNKNWETGQLLLRARHLEAKCKNSGITSLLYFLATNEGLSSSVALTYYRHVLSAMVLNCPCPFFNQISSNCKYNRNVRNKASNNKPNHDPNSIRISHAHTKSSFSHSLFDIG